MGWWVLGGYIESGLDWKRNQLDSSPSGIGRSMGCWRVDDCSFGFEVGKKECTSYTSLHSLHSICPRSEVAIQVFKNGAQ